jgi:hypothetical protein
MVLTEVKLAFAFRPTLREGPQSRPSGDWITESLAPRSDVTSPLGQGRRQLWRLNRDGRDVCGRIVPLRIARVRTLGYSIFVHRPSPRALLSVLGTLHNTHRRSRFGRSPILPELTKSGSQTRLVKTIQPPARRLGTSHGFAIGTAETSSSGITASMRNPSQRSSCFSSPHRYKCTYIPLIPR